MGTAIRERKILQGGYVVKADADQGIVDAYVSVFGIVDMDDDVIENGAFARTIAERGPAGANKIRVLNQHQWQEIVGKPLMLAEHARDQLPDELTARFPDATGALFTRTQFNMEKQASRDVFSDIKGGFQNEWSIGFDTINSDADTVDERHIRRLKELRLWEYSPVTWGANQATLTTDVKSSNADMARGQIDYLDKCLANGEIDEKTHLRKSSAIMLSYGLATDESLKDADSAKVITRLIERLSKEVNSTSTDVKVANKEPITEGTNILWIRNSTPPDHVADSVTGKLLELAGVVLGDKPDLELPELLHELSNRLTQDAPPQAGAQQTVDPDRRKLAKAQLDSLRRRMRI